MSRHPGAAKDSRDSLQKRYDLLWAAAIRKIFKGLVELDPVLQAGKPDQRRGLTIIGRPAAAVARSVSAFLNELKQLEPDQYYYAAPEFHITILSLFTATKHFRRFFDQKDRYINAVARVLKEFKPIHINFEGITASPGTVMIQGFVEAGRLNELRNRLRRQLRTHGLAEGLDQRYRLQTAHMTVVRLREPFGNARRFAAALEAARQRPFGKTTLTKLLLVQHDWYMSQRVTKTLKTY